jgi:hypothetical protein
MSLNNTGAQYDQFRNPVQRYAAADLIEGLGEEDAEKVTALKGRDFSPAANSPFSIRLLAAEGVLWAPADFFNALLDCPESPPRRRRAREIRTCREPRIAGPSPVME